MATAKKEPKRYYWWKLQENFFTQIAIKKLRRSENGDKKTLIYLQMILMTINNDGYIRFEGVEDTIGDEIAMVLDEEPEIVHETIRQLMDMGLIELDEEDYFLPEANECIGSETESAKRMREKRKRDKEKRKRDKETSHCDINVTSSDTDVTQRRVEKRKRVREEKEYISDSTNTYPNDPEDIANLFNDICKSYQPVINYMEYSKQLSTCIAFGYTMNDYRLAFANAERSDYLKGLVDNKSFPSNFGWILEHLDDVKKCKYN